MPSFFTLLASRSENDLCPWRDCADNPDEPFEIEHEPENSPYDPDSQEMHLSEQQKANGQKTEHLHCPVLRKTPCKLRLA